MNTRQTDDPKDHQIALPNIRSYPDTSGPMDASEKDEEEDEDERVDVVGTTDTHTEASHGKLC